jgi:hypothetical protein
MVSIRFDKIIIVYTISMPKRAVSITLDEGNLLWLKGRARVLAGGSLSEAVDQLIEEAREGLLGGAQPRRSVVGTIDLPDDNVLAAANTELRDLFTASLDRTVRDSPARPATAKTARKK